MIQEKSFHLKVREHKVRWGCSCCQPLSRQTGKAGKKIVRKIIKGRNRAEKRVIDKINALEILGDSILE